MSARNFLRLSSDASDNNLHKMIELIILREFPGKNHLIGRTEIFKSSPDCAFVSVSSRVVVEEEVTGALVLL